MVGAKHKVSSSASAARPKSSFDGFTQASRLDVNLEDDRYSDDDIPEKDEAEEKLEKLLFGDDDGFKAALKNHGEQRVTDLVMLDSNEDGDGGEDGEENLDDVADEDVSSCQFFFLGQLLFILSQFLTHFRAIQLFFLDSGAADTGDALDTRPDFLAIEEKGEPGIVSRPAVWVDSDDERMAISLAGHQRLRKLRVAESEDVVDGTEYIRRLRNQYLRLHPTPDWANPELRRKQRKKRAGSSSGSEEGLSGSESEMDTDEDNTDISVKPLAKLLQGAGDLVRGSEDGTTGRNLKLRQEVIDIRRLKDVGGVQPVRYKLGTLFSLSLSFFFY